MDFGVFIRNTHKEQVPMEQRPLGRTGVSVSKLCLGAMMFGEWGTKDHDESIRIIHRALEAGVNLIDTADVYSASDLVHAGKVRYIGHSTWPASAIVEAQWTSKERALERFMSEQPSYSILTRAVELDILATCARFAWGSSATARSPPAGCRAGIAGTPSRRDRPRCPASGSSTASTFPCRKTSASSTRPTCSPGSPRKLASP
jgi:aryl-alcohol dehydrogenase-like predicted oxidoreductase